MLGVEPVDATYLDPSYGKDILAREVTAPCDGRDHGTGCGCQKQGVRLVRQRQRICQFRFALHISDFAGDQLFDAMRTDFAKAASVAPS